MEYTRTTQVTFIQVIDNKSFVIKCRGCEGIGRRMRRVFQDTWQGAEWESEACPICQGKGALRLESDDIPTNCGPCHGIGLSKSNDYSSSYINGKPTHRLDDRLDRLVHLAACR